MKQSAWMNGLLGACLLVPGSASGQSNGSEDIPESIVRKVDPSVVMIQHERAVGSGFVITKDGYENLSAGLPRTVEEIEALMREPGLLQKVER